MASAAAVAFAAAPAFADGDDMSMRAGNYWYAGLSAGLNNLDDISPDTAFGAILDTAFDNGYALMATVGYHWPNGLRAEVEVGYRDNNAGSGTQAPAGPVTQLDGGVTQLSLMANVLYDIHLADEVSISLGGGLGASNTKFDIHGFGDPLIVDAGSSNWAFAWQLIAGLSYSMSPNTAFFVEYRYMRNDNLDVTTFPEGFPLDDKVDAQNQTASLGVRFALDR